MSGQCESEISSWDTGSLPSGFSLFLLPVRLLGKTDLVRVTLAVMRCHDQINSAGKGSFCLSFYITVLHQRKSGQELTQGRDLEAGADAEAIEGTAYWLASPGLLSLLSYRPQDPPAQGWPHPQYAGSITN